MQTNNNKRVFLWVVVIIATIGLTACVKAEISVDVKQNGSGIISIAMGLNQQARLLASSQGNNPMQELRKGLETSTPETQDVKIATWTDGDYEWAKAEKEFTDLNEINRVLNNNELFSNFLLARHPGLLRDEFTLEAELSPLNNNTPSASGLSIDPSAFIQVNFSARLPGKIVETNGSRDINDPNRIVWSMESNQPVSMKARSLSWNWINILVMAGVLLVFGSVIIAGFAYFLYTASRKNKQAKRAQPIESLPIDQVSSLADLGVENLLLEINTKVLDSKGQINMGKGEIELIWKDALLQQRTIDVKELSSNQISINNQVCAATKQGTRAAIIDALRQQVKGNDHINPN